MPDPTPQILESARRFRQQLLARERRAASAMVRYYGDTWGRLQPEIRRLRAEVEGMRAAGEEVNPGQVNGLARLRSIEAQAQQQLLQFTEYADDAIRGAEREAIAAAERDAPALMRAAYPADAPITIRFDRMPREAVENLVGFLQDGSPLADLLADVVQDAADKFGSTMVTGMAAGWNPRRLARALRSEFGMGLTQALKISRTEQLRAYSTATLNSYQTSNVVTDWERMATLSPRTCMACLMLDGKRYGPDEPMDDHVQGTCSMLPITKSYAEMGIDAPEPDFTREKGHDWFLRQDEGVQRGILGDGKFDAWKDGQFKLEDVPKLTKSRIWGNSWTPKTLKELVPKAELSMIQWAEKQYKSWAGNLTRDERWALGDYQSVGYHANRNLRQGLSLESEDQKLVRVLDRAISKGRIDRELTVYRGSGISWLPKRRDPQDLVGMIVQDRGFLSTSLDKEMGRHFATMVLDAEPAASVWEISLPKGTRAAYMAVPQVGGLSEEQELLLGRGQRLKITGIGEETVGLEGWGSLAEIFLGRKITIIKAMII